VRTTVELEDDVLAIVAAEQRRTGESRGQVIGRLIRRGSGVGHPDPPTLPVVDADILVDISDVSSVLLELWDADIVAARDGFEANP
jgi:hypothetical protein